VIEYLPWPNSISFLLAMPQKQGKKPSAMNEKKKISIDLSYS